MKRRRIRHCSIEEELGIVHRDEIGQMLVKEESSLCWYRGELIEWGWSISISIGIKVVSNKD